MIRVNGFHLAQVWRHAARIKRVQFDLKMRYPLHPRGDQVGVAKSVDALGLKPNSSHGVRVRVPSPTPFAALACLAAKRIVQPLFQQSGDQALHIGPHALKAGIGFKPHFVHVKPTRQL